MNAPFVHVVLFTLPEDANPEERDQIIADIDGMLRPLATIRHLDRGVPADTATRPIVMTDYDVGLLVLFDDKAGLVEYLEHPDHVVFAKKWDTRCQIRVFDFEPPERLEP